jgi:hypothetical protein
MMLNSTLRSLTAGTAFLALTIWGLTSVMPNNTPAYAPRPEAPAQQPDGAAAIQRALLGDADGNIDWEGLDVLRQKVEQAAAIKAGTKSNGPEWVELGPDNIGGRTRAIAAVPGTNTLYVGAISGGLWRSDNRGDNWTQVKSFPNLVIGSVAVAGNGDLYVGTGSYFDFNNGNGDSGGRGRGIYYSNDGGASWSAVTLATGGSTIETAGGNPDYSWNATDGLAPDPNEPNKVWCASVKGFGSLVDGVFTGLPNGVNVNAATDVAIAPDGSYCLVATTGGAVYRSVGEDFTDLESISQGLGTNGMLPTSGISRARVGIAQTEVNEGDGYNGFALYATSNSLFRGLYYSGQSGEEGTWDEIWPGEIQTATPLPYGQGFYDLALGVSMANPTLAYVGGVELWRSGFNQQAEQAAAPVDFAGFPYGVHADVHEIIFVDDSTSNGVMYVATDGGIYRSIDNGYSYTACNRDYNVTQFYGIAHSAGSAVLGGTQDNGSLMIPGDGYFLSDQMAVDVNGGDGFDCAISQVTEAVGYEYAWFAASQNGGLTRGTLAPGAVNNIGAFYDANFIGLDEPDGELGQFYTCTRLFEDFSDTLYSQNHVTLINTFGQDSVGGVYTLQTSSQNLPFEFNMGEDTLHFYDSIVRPERILSEPLTEDPDYFWLNPQLATQDIQCLVVQDTVGYDTMLIETPVVLDSTVLIVNEQGDSLYFTVEVPTGDIDSTFVVSPIVESSESCDTVYIHAADVLYNIPEHLKVRDPYNTMFAIGLNGNYTVGSPPNQVQVPNRGVWITREALNFNTNPSWIRVADCPQGVSGTKAIEFVETGASKGDVMFFTGWNGSVTRVSGLRNVYSQDDVDQLEVKTILAGAGGAVTGLSVDPNDANHVVVTVGGYTNVPGQGVRKVRETFNALAPDFNQSTDWENIWTDDFPNMPCYDVVIDAADASGETIVVGTEFGVFVTENGGDTWEISNDGMSNDAGFTAAVHDLKQQFRSSNAWSDVTNAGAIYAGTHGRGIFMTGSIVTSVEEAEETAVAGASWNIFPNPVATGELNLPTLGWQGNATVEVFDLTGRRWVNDQRQVGGVERVTANVSDLPAGYYVVRMSQGGKSQAARFMVQR